jgi:serine/threonine protein kinase
VLFKEGDLENAYYIPTSKDRLKTLLEEVELVKKIAGDVEPTTRLAVDYEIVGDTTIDGYPVIKTSRAAGDLTKRIGQEISWEERFELCYGYSEGIAQLHAGGYVAMDIKPCNALIYGKNFVKVADFGKAGKVTDWFPIYSGNTRFMDPLNPTSQKGEVYSVALVLISILEAPLLREGERALIPVSKPRAVPGEGRYGVEHYVIQHPDCVAVEADVGITGGLARLAGKVIGRERAIHAIHQYIDVLAERLEALQGQDKAEAIANLLKDMTRSKLEARPSMEMVCERLRGLGFAQGV